MPTCSNHSGAETELACGACGRPMCGECLTSLEAEEEMRPLLLCPACLERHRHALRRALEMETQDVAWGRAALVGAAAALAGALAWYGAARLSGERWLLVAPLVGLAVGNAVMRGAGRKRGLGLQAMAALLTLASLAAGEYLILDYLEKGLLGLQGESPGAPFLPAGPFYEHLRGLPVEGWAFLAASLFAAFMSPVPRRARARRE